MTVLGNSRNNKSKGKGKHGRAGEVAIVKADVLL